MRQKALELAKYLDRLNGYMDMPRDILDITQPAAAIIRELVEELDKQSEPVAWMAEHFDGRKRVEIAGNVYDQDVGWGHKRIPLYTTPQTKPLSDEEIWEWFEKNTALTKESALMIARAIEKEHGIK